MDHQSKRASVLEKIFVTYIVSNPRFRQLSISICSYRTILTGNLVSIIQCLARQEWHSVKYEVSRYKETMDLWLSSMLSLQDFVDSKLNDHRIASERLELLERKEIEAMQKAAAKKEAAAARVQPPERPYVERPSTSSQSRRRGSTTTRAQRLGHRISLDDIMKMLDGALNRVMSTQALPTAGVQTLTQGQEEAPERDTSSASQQLLSIDQLINDCMATAASIFGSDILNTEQSATSKNSTIEELVSRFDIVAQRAAAKISSLESNLQRTHETVDNLIDHYESSLQILTKKLKREEQQKEREVTQERVTQQQATQEEAAQVQQPLMFDDELARYAADPQGTLDQLLAELEALTAANLAAMRSSPKQVPCEETTTSQATSETEEPQPGTSQTETSITTEPSVESLQNREDEKIPNKDSE